MHSDWRFRMREARSECIRCLADTHPHLAFHFTSLFCLTLTAILTFAKCWGTVQILQGWSTFLIQIVYGKAASISGTVIIEMLPLPSATPLRLRKWLIGIIQCFSCELHAWPFLEQLLDTVVAVLAKVTTWKEKCVCGTANEIEPHHTVILRKSLLMLQLHSRLHSALIPLFSAGINFSR